MLQLQHQGVECAYGANRTPSNRTSSALADSAALQPSAVLTRALAKAGKELGLTQADLGAIVGRDRTALSRGSHRTPIEVG